MNLFWRLVEKLVGPLEPAPRARLLELQKHLDRAEERAAAIRTEMSKLKFGVIGGGCGFPCPEERCGVCRRCDDHHGDTPCIAKDFKDFIR